MFCTCNKYNLLVMDSRRLKECYRGVTFVVNQGSSRSHGQEAKG